MSAWIRKTQVAQSLFAIAVLLALFLRVAIPAGFMPAAGSHGLTLQLCSQSAAHAITLDVGQKTPLEKPSNADSPCTFAAGLGQGLLANTLAFAVQPVAFGPIAAAGAAVAHLTVQRLAAPPPPSQGPPQLR
jgi:hypothetical protein